MAKRKKKKSVFSSWFYRIWFLFVIAAAGAILYGANYLTGIMIDYEATRPVYVAESTAKLFTDADFDTIYEYDTATSIMNGEPKQEYIDYMKNYLTGKNITWSEAASGNQNEKKYVVKADDEKFATFTIHPSGETSENNFDYWTMGTVTTNVLSTTEYFVTAPSDSVVIANGKTLSEADAVETDIKTKCAGLLPEGVPEATYTKYHFTLCFAQPEISVTDRYGDPQELKQDGEHEWSCEIVYNDALRSQCEESVFTLAKKIANYTSEDLSQSKILKYCRKDSPAYKYMKAFDNQWCPSHTGYEFKDMTSYDYYDYTQDCFSCTVSFKYVIHYAKNDDNVYDTTYTLYFQKGEKGGFKLYNFTLY